MLNKYTDPKLAYSQTLLSAHADDWGGGAFMLVNNGVRIYELDKRRPA